MAYYRRIRDLREDHDLTQRQLAAILHMPQPQYTRYEQGLLDIRRRPRPAKILIKNKQPSAGIHRPRKAVFLFDFVLTRSSAG